MVNEPDLGLFAVADGIGGQAAGHVASRLALEAVQSFVSRSDIRQEGDQTGAFTWPFGVDPALSFAGNRILTSMKAANRIVHRSSEQEPDHEGMGTTLTLALVSQHELAYGNVGDSRLYSFLDGSLTQLTQDDSWLSTVQSDPRTDHSALDQHPLRHVLTKCIGAQDQVTVEVHERELRSGEILLLTTDGVHDVLSDEAIIEILASQQSPDGMSKLLVQAALDKGSRDNVTALLVRYTQ